jgi:hypothetical protein
MDGDQRPELVATTIPTWVRVLAGVTYPFGSARKIRSCARYGISEIAEKFNKTNWLPILDTFRTFVAQLAV